VRGAIAFVILAACHGAPTNVAPRPLTCGPDRIGKVTVIGGTAADVPQLAVLEGTLDDGARTDRVATLATELLRARGYARAALAIERHEGCGIELVVRLDRGPRYTIDKIAFDTDDDYPAASRLAEVEDVLGTVNAVGGSFVADRLDRALAQLERRYQDAGWLDAAIRKPQVEFDDARHTVSLTIPVEAGERFKVGNVVARGGRRSTRAAVIDALGLRGGQWFDGRAVRQAIERARREVGEHVELRVQVAKERAAIDLEAIVGTHR
jgi:outer membrane protein assembly factor BamA